MIGRIHGLHSTRRHPGLVHQQRANRLVDGAVDHGWRKDDIRRYLYDNIWIAADDAERYAYYIGLTGFRLRDQVAKGLLSPDYCASDDPKRRVRVFLNPESIGIVIAGDPVRNQSKCYCSNHTQGPPVSRKVALPQKWDELLPRR